MKKTSVIIIIISILIMLFLCWISGLFTIKITIIVPNRFKGAISVIEDKDSDTENISIFRNYVWLSDNYGRVKVKNKEILEEWHRLRAVYSSGEEIPYNTRKNQNTLPESKIFIFDSPGIDSQGDFFIGTKNEARKNHYY